MKRLTFRVFCLIIVSLFFTSCGSLSFIASKENTYRVSRYEKKSMLLEKESTLDFYFWGMLPGSASIDLYELGNNLGVEQPSSLVIEQFISFKNVFYTVITLGLYSPVDYKISMHTQQKAVLE